MVFINFKKIFILILLFLLTTSNILAAAGVDLEAIQNLIREGELEEALNILKNNELNSDPDLKFYKALLLSWQEDYEDSEQILLALIERYPERLDFYNQLARIYGWQREFKQAEEIIKQAQSIEYSEERTVLLAQHAEWQQKWYKAKSLLEKAAAETDSEELRSGYKESLARIEEELKTLYYLEGRFVYSELDKEDLHLAFGGEKPLLDGINLNTAAGINYFKTENNFFFRTGLDFTFPIMPQKITLSSEVIYYNGSSRDKYELNNSFNYLINLNSRLGVNFNYINDNTNPDYQSLELEYEHRFKKIIMVLKNTARNYPSDSESGWKADFSQHLDIYYPLDNYVLNFALNHYNGNDGREYIFKIGLEFSDLFSGKKINLKNLNLWLNDQKTSNLDFRLNLK